MEALHLGMKILRARYALKWSQAKLAGRAGVKPYQVSRIEHGIITDIEATRRVMEALNLSTDVLNGLE